MISKLAYPLVIITGLIITGFVGYGFVAGDGWNEVATLAAMPWGLTTLIDVYAGLVLFCGWVLYREKQTAPRIAWCLAILLGGNALAAAYALYALITSKRDATTFWLGPHPQTDNTNRS